jgi:hypothetical protein
MFSLNYMIADFHTLKNMKPSNTFSYEYIAEGIYVWIYIIQQRT